MKSVPRILPLLGIAVGGVLAVNAISGARDLPGLLAGAQAFAEEQAAPAKGAKPAGKSGAADVDATAETGQPKDAAVTLPTPSVTPRAVCAPTAAELAKAAGLSPAELQVLQSLGQRRGVLDKRESDFSTQLALMAAAEAKLDAKIRSLNGLKGEVQGLLSQTDAKQATEIDRLVKVFEGMKAKDAAPRLATLDNSVRVPIAAKMKERSLSAIVAQMSPAQAKELTELLARRFSDARAAAAKADQIANPPAAAPAPAAKAPPRRADAPPPRRRAPAAAQAAAKPEGGPVAPPPASAPAAAAPVAAAPPAATAG